MCLTFQQFSSGLQHVLLMVQLPSNYQNLPWNLFQMTKTTNTRTFGRSIAFFGSFLWVRLNFA